MMGHGDDYGINVGDMFRYAFTLKRITYLIVIEKYGAAARCFNLTTQSFIEEPYHQLNTFYTKVA